MKTTHKIRLVKIFTEENHCGDGYYDTISSVINFTDWTELTFKEVDILRKFVQETNSFNQAKANGGCYDHIALVYYHEPYEPKILLDELVKKEKARIDKIKQDEADKEAARIKHLAETAEERKAKQKARLEKKLAKLNEEQEKLKKALS